VPLTQQYLGADRDDVETTSKRIYFECPDDGARNSGVSKRQLRLVARNVRFRRRFEPRASAPRCESRRVGLRIVATDARLLALIALRQKPGRLSALGVYAGAGNRYARPNAAAPYPDSTLDNVRFESVGVVVRPSV
jgi:hypothetical protein